MLIRLPKPSISSTPSVMSGTPPPSVESTEIPEIAPAPSHPSPRQNEAQALPVGTQRLIDRVVAGQGWLAVVRDALLAQADAGVGSRIERRYVDGLLELVELERLLRFTYEYTGCARGELGPCDPLAVVRCEACAGLERG